MPEHRDRMLVLRSRPYREHDALVTLFGERLGKVAAVARGALRSAGRLQGACQVLAVSWFGLHEGRSTLWTVTAGDLDRLFPRVRADLGRMGRAAMLADTVDELMSERDAAPDTFRTVVEALTALDDGRSPAVVFASALWRLLKEAGFMPDIGTCHQCGAAIGDTAWWRPGHGPVCARCRTPADTLVRAGGLSLLRYWDRLPPERIGQGSGPSAVLRQLEQLAVDQLVYHTGRVPRAYRVWQQVADLAADADGPARE
jgi:DNA repair protein RecO (recombination protein O)